MARKAIDTQACLNKADSNRSKSLKGEPNREATLQWGKTLFYPDLLGFSSDTTLSQGLPNVNVFAQPDFVHNKDAGNGWRGSLFIYNKIQDTLALANPLFPWCVFRVHSSVYATIHQ